MKIAVVSAVNRGGLYYPGADEARHRYCASHGYPYTAGRTVPPECDWQTAAWSNFNALRQLIMEQNFDIAVWMDPDTVVTAPEIGLEDILAPLLHPAVGGDQPCDVIVGTDMMALEIGIAVVINNERTRKWLATINGPDFFENRDFGFFEQDPFMRSLANSDMLSIFPRWGMFGRDSARGGD